MSQRTPRHPMHLMLNKKPNQRHKRPKESIRRSLPILDRLRIRWAKHNTPDCPGECSDEVRDHEDVVPVVVVGGGDVGPAAAGEGAEDADAGDEFGEGAAAAGGHEVPEGDEGEPGALLCGLVLNVLLCVDVDRYRR